MARIIAANSTENQTVTSTLVIALIEVAPLVEGQIVADPEVMAFIIVVPLA